MMAVISFLYLNPFAGCKAVLNDSYGEISSPGFGFIDYPTLQSCTWSINLPPGIKYSVIFTHVQLGTGDSLKVGTSTLVYVTIGTDVNIKLHHSLYHY